VRSPSVERHVDGTISVDVEAYWKWRTNFYISRLLKCRNTACRNSACRNSACWNRNCLPDISPDTVLARLDYGSTVLTGISRQLMDRLQSVLNAAARLIYSRRKYDRVTPLLIKELHWLRVPQNGLNFDWPFLCSSAVTRQHLSIWLTICSGPQMTIKNATSFSFVQQTRHVQVATFNSRRPRLRRHRTSTFGTVCQHASPQRIHFQPSRNI